MKRIIWLFLLTVFLCGCAQTENRAPSAEVWLLNVGKGDAIIVQTQGKTFLIDAAKPERWGIVQTFLREKGVTRLDAVFLTHADGDHAGGLALLAQTDIEVGAWYASAYTLEEECPAEQAAAQRGQQVTRLRAGDEAEDVFSVLAPAVCMEDKEDNNSLVFIMDTAAGRLLLSGDMEFPEEAELLARGEDLQSEVLKVANHGDDDTLSRAFLEAVRPRIALISTDPYEKPGTPDAALLGRLRDIGAEVYRTDESGAGVHLVMDENGARAEYIAPGAYPEPQEGIFLEGADPRAETVTVVNGSGVQIDLSGWYIHSDRGDEALLFAPGTRLLPGQRLTVATLSAQTPGDVLWESKNVVHNSKTDTLTLYDAWGRFVTSVDNGL